jgi:DNA-binding NarL/FixJ family response regulator
MIVEDEVLLAIDIEAMVQGSGYQVIAEAASLYDIIDLPDDLRPHLAFVDMQLAQDTNGLDVARLIQQRCVCDRQSSQESCRLWRCARRHSSAVFAQRSDVCNALYRGCGV